MGVVKMDGESGEVKEGNFVLPLIAGVRECKINRDKCD